MSADEIVVGQAGDGQYRLSIQFRIIETVEQMQAAGPRRREAHTQTAGELRISARHEAGCFFMTNLDEANGVALFSEGFHDAVNTVTRKTENCVDTPVLKNLNQDF
jgi:hypothetical protein